MINIHDYSWEKYLEREQPILIFTLFDKSYGELLKEVTGFGFSKQLYYVKDKLGVFYKLKDELAQADEYYSKLISDSDSRISMWIQKEADMHSLITSLEINMSLKEIVHAAQEILLYNTVIPYRLLSASQKVKIDSNLFEQLEKIRMHSLYPDLVNGFLPKVFEKLSKNSGISINLLYLCTPEELIAIDKGSYTVTESALKKRIEGCYFFKGKQWQFEFSAEDKYNIINKQEELKGSIAYKGVAKGKVKIINNPKDMNKFSKGDILVSINTNPSLMPAIKMSSAIVADEGGITCHAAIVARELKKPCIIGTKNATKILKDGDIVEVDAIKGIIKIIQ